MPSIYFLKEWILQLDTSVAIQLIILLILLILSGFFSSAETALTTVNRMRIRGLADEGNKKAKTVMHITDDTSKMLSAILIGNNVVNLSAASLTTTLAYNLGGSMVAVASAVLSVLIIIFGEITPKTNGYTACREDVSSLCSGHQSVHQGHDTICIYYHQAF